MNRATLFGVGSAIVCQLILLVIAGWHNRHMISPDSVVYCRIASYYLNGQFDVAVSGYWGPMISWVIAPLLLVFDDPLDAARLVMGLSAVFFLLGCLATFRQLDLSNVAIVLGTWLVALSSVYWSSRPITPDLLLSAFICFAISLTMSPRWLVNRRTQLAAGMLWGAAYLTKAAGLPIAVVVVVVIAGLFVVTQHSSVRVALQSVAVTMISLFLLAAPWIVTLSLKYRGLVWSTAGPLNHAIVGPRAPQVGFHPAVFHAPEPGHLFWFEDPPAVLYQTQQWSPFESWAFAKYQLKLIYLNVDGVIKTFGNLDWLHLALGCLVLALLVHKPWRENMRAHRWRWSGALIACVAVVYLPVFAHAERYFYTTYPFLIAASVALVIWLTRTTPGGLNFPRLIGLTLLVLSFSNPIRRELPGALRGVDYPLPIYARDLAGRLKAAGLEGPLAGAGPNDNQWRGEQIGPYLAFFTNQPYLGSGAAPSADEVRSSGAKILVLDRHLKLDGLENDPTFRDLDGVLFGSPEEANKYPLKVYQVISP